MDHAITARVLWIIVLPAPVPLLAPRAYPHLPLLLPLHVPATPRLISTQLPAPASSALRSPPIATPAPIHPAQLVLVTLP